MPAKASQLAPVTADARPIHEFKLPESVLAAAGTDILTLGFVELRMQEELDAIASAKGSDERVSYALTMKGLVEINGQPVDRTGGGMEATWARMHPLVRQLALRAFTSLHAPEETTVKDFLKGRVVQQR